MDNEFSDVLLKPEAKLGYLFWQINMLWLRKVNKSLLDIGLTHTQLITLAATESLNHTTDRVIQRDVAEKIKVDRMLISKLVSKLVEAELLQKKNSAEDSRVNLLSLTSTGRKLLHDASGILEKNEGEFFGLIEEDVPFLKKKLTKLLQLTEEEFNSSKK